MAQFDQELRIADVYAAALFSLAREADMVAEIRAELDELVRLLDREREFEKFVTSRALEADAREVGLEQMLRGRLSDLLLNTLLVMNRHGRCGLLRALRLRYVMHQEDAANEIEARVTSAVELSRDQRADIEVMIADRTGKRPLVEYVVDESIVGGLIVHVGDVLMDNSVRRQLRELSRRLRQRAQRGLSEVPVA